MIAKVKKNHSSKIYIAGHTGMVGSAVVRALRDEGYDNLLLRTHEELDLTDRQAVNKFFNQESPDYVMVAAAKVGGIEANRWNRTGFLYENTIIAMNVIMSAWQHGVANLMFLGSSCVYPRDAEQPIRESSLLSAPPEETNEGYALAKISGVKLCQYLYEEKEANYFSIMPCNLYGPNDNYDEESSHVLPAMINRFHRAVEDNAASVTCWGDGSPLREFMHVDDLANLIVFLMENYRVDSAPWDNPTIINAGTGSEISIKNLAEMVAGIAGYEGEIIWDESLPNGTPRKVLNIDRIQSLGWQHKINLEDGIRRVYQEYCL